MPPSPPPKRKLSALQDDNTDYDTKRVRPTLPPIHTLPNYLESQPQPSKVYVVTYQASNKHWHESEFRVVSVHTTAEAARKAAQRECERAFNQDGEGYWEPSPSGEWDWTCQPEKLTMVEVKVSEQTLKSEEGGSEA